MHIIDVLEAVVQQRRHSDPDKSYVASLHAKGLNAILKKVGEESVETILAATELDRTATAHARADFVGEVCDLWFHVLVALAKLDVPVADVYDELQRRFGTSGLEEKAARSQRAESSPSSDAPGDPNAR